MIKKAQRIICASIRRVLAERTLLAAAAGAVFLAGVLAQRHRDLTGRARCEQMVRKSLYRHEADVVVAGDSRVFHGVWPERMESGLGGGLRVRNFGFGAAGFSRRFCEAIESVLDPSSPRPVVVLGISPASLTEGTQQRNGYLEVLGQRWNQRWMSLHFGRLLRPLEPMSVNEIVAMVGLKRLPRKYRHYREDGAVASHNDPADFRAELATYSQLFGPAGYGPVSEEVVGELLEQVRRWRARGIEVRAFRTPTSPQMRELEDRLSGFDERSFARRFRRAGGLWLELPADGWRSCDGNHLDRLSARRLSTVLARSLKAPRPGGLPVYAAAAPGEGRSPGETTRNP